MMDPPQLCTQFLLPCKLCVWRLCSGLPAEAFATLAALVMDLPQLAAALQAAESTASNGSPGAKHADAPAGDGAAGRQQEAAGAGLRMAVLTSAARLLEAKVRAANSPNSNPRCLAHACIT